MFAIGLSATINP